ncbi:MAG: cytochrome P450 [Pseudomonadota bacterium]
MIPPKPAPRADRVGLWHHLRLFRKDILSAQPARLYRAKMAEFRAPFLRSVLINDPGLIREVLVERPEAFPKSGRVTRGLSRLLGNSVFVTNGKTWARQREIVNRTFDGPEIRRVFPALLAAGEAAAERVEPGVVDVEPMASRAAADVIFRALFSRPIEDEVAQGVYGAFRDYARAQPIVTPAAFVPWAPTLHGRRTRVAAKRVRRVIRDVVEARAGEIATGVAPDDLGTRLMTATHPEAGPMDPGEVLDQVAIFFLAGHETSAAALAWALYLVADDPGLQEDIAAEWEGFAKERSFSALARMGLTRDVFRETLRLYPPVPMMVRETSRAETFRKRHLPSGTQVVISPWHLHRHEARWEDPDRFDPSRWERRDGQGAFVPFSTGPRVCPGASFAMAEGVVLLAAIVARHQITRAGIPVPVAHLTVRSRDGILLRFSPRSTL